MHITKRGSRTARRWLYFVALRQIKEDPIVKAWFERRRQRNGDQGVKAVVAVMRKLVRGLWHVARGERFDAQKLFDVDNLAKSFKTLTITREAS